MTRRPEASFSGTYREARGKFLDAARAAGLAVESKVHPERGAEGEELAMDVARDGDPGAPSVLVVSSGCHGVEGFCGSGAQVEALHDPAWLAFARGRGVAVLYVHALNPYGFSWLSRTTHENIDLNRNFHDFSASLPENPGYRELHELLVPGEWPPTDANRAAIARYVADRGMPALQAATSRGQHDFGDGLFFGGRAPSWSNRAVREVLREHASRATRVAWIDFHTGLGPTGLGERIYAGRNDPAAIARARRWWDGGGRTPITSIFDGSSTSAFLTGLMTYCADEECPRAEVTSLALEYGTVPIEETLEALRGDAWLRRHPEAPPDVRASIRQRMRDAFYTDTPEWKRQVVEQGLEAMRQAVDGLSA